MAPGRAEVTNRLDRLTKSLNAATQRSLDYWESTVEDLLADVTTLLSDPQVSWQEPRRWQSDHAIPLDRREFRDMIRAIHLKVRMIVSSTCPRCGLSQHSRHHQESSRCPGARSYHRCEWPRERVIELQDAVKAYTSKPKAPRSSPFSDLFRILGRNAPTLAEEIIEVGYKTLAGRLHPDHGGSEEQMKELNAAVEWLRGRQ